MTNSLNVYAGSSVVLVCALVLLDIAGFSTNSTAASGSASSAADSWSFMAASWLGS